MGQTGWHITDGTRAAKAGDTNGNVTLHTEGTKMLLATGSVELKLAQ